MMTGKVILCVDDESFVLKSLVRTLRKEPYRVIISESPIRALEIIQQEKVDLILSDYRMEEMSGLEMLKKIIEILPHSKRIILSGYADEILIRDALNNGLVHRYLLKPYDSEMLKSEIISLLGQGE